jgi:hypothetical protein
MAQVRSVPGMAEKRDVVPSGKSGGGAERLTSWRAAQAVLDGPLDVEGEPQVIPLLVTTHGLFWALRDVLEAIRFKIWRMTKSLRWDHAAALEPQARLCLFPS